MLPSADSWERSVWSHPRTILIQGSTLTLRVQGKKNVFPLLACGILDLPLALQVAPARAHARAWLSEPHFITSPSSMCSFQPDAEHFAG